jgi:hypothetical protein
MPQIKFPHPTDPTLPDDEMTGISLGTFGGVETFLVVDPSGNVVARNRAPEEAKAVDTPATDTRERTTPATGMYANDTPATYTPATETPATYTPATETPATYTPATETPATFTPATDTPAV